jgi:organic radical activating enzyme
MSLGEARGYVDEASGIPSVEWISFTGGEPFLLPMILNEIVCYTNAK